MKMEIKGSVGGRGTPQQQSFLPNHDGKKNKEINLTGFSLLVDWKAHVSLVSLFMLHFKLSFPRE